MYIVLKIMKAERSVLFTRLAFDDIHGTTAFGKRIQISA